MSIVDKEDRFSACVPCLYLRNEALLKPLGPDDFISPAILRGSNTKKSVSLIVVSNLEATHIMFLSTVTQSSCILAPANTNPGITLLVPSAQTTSITVTS